MLFATDYFPASRARAGSTAPSARRATVYATLRGYPWYFIRAGDGIKERIYLLFESAPFDFAQGAEPFPERSRRAAPSKPLILGRFSTVKISLKRRSADLAVKRHELFRHGVDG